MTGTAAQPRQLAERKCRGYAELARHQIYLKHFPAVGSDEFRVLLVVPDEARRDAVRRAFQEKDPAEYRTNLGGSWPIQTSPWIPYSMLKSSSAVAPSRPSSSSPWRVSARGRPGRTGRTRCKAGNPGVRGSARRGRLPCTWPPAVPCGSGAVSTPGMKRTVKPTSTHADDRERWDDQQVKQQEKQHMIGQIGCADEHLQSTPIARGSVGVVTNRPLL